MNEAFVVNKGNYNLVTIDKKSAFPDASRFKTLMDNPLILTLNPGSTSVKIAVWKGNSVLHEKEVRVENATDIPKGYDNQGVFWANRIMTFLAENNVKELHAIVGRGGLMMPIKGGTYEVSEQMVEHCVSCVNGDHASNAGVVIAMAIGQAMHVPANRVLTVNPVIVDELDAAARISGDPEYPIVAKWHALNHKACADIVSQIEGKPYEDMYMTGAHLGGGITVVAHNKGRVTSISDRLGGVLSPTGSKILVVDMFKLIENELTAKCDEMFTRAFDEDYLTSAGRIMAVLKSVQKRLFSEGGLKREMGTDNVQTLMELAGKGDVTAEPVYEALIRGITKEYYMHTGALEGPIDAGILTGGLMQNEVIAGELATRILRNVRPHPIYVIPGEGEMRSMAQAAIRVIEGEITPKQYPY